MPNESNGSPAHDLSPHIKDLITAYKAQPRNMRRGGIIESLEKAYLLATSDTLEATLNTKSATGRELSTLIK